jgi:hypothetical protein
MALGDMWNESVKLVREIFMLEKGEIEEGRGVTTVRLGILIEANFVEGRDARLVIRLNNQQLLNLENIDHHSQITLSMLILDLNRQ